MIFAKWAGTRVRDYSRILKEHRLCVLFWTAPAPAHWRDNTSTLLQFGSLLEHCKYFKWNIADFFKIQLTKWTQICKSWCRNTRTTTTKITAVWALWKNSNFIVMDCNGRELDEIPDKEYKRMIVKRSTKSKNR